MLVEILSLSKDLCGGKSPDEKIKFMIDRLKVKSSFNELERKSVDELSEILKSLK